MSNLAVLQKDLTDRVSEKVATLKNEGLVIAPNYLPANALKSAFFAMTNATGENLLEKCTPESVANALLDMVVQGLNPAKTQCYFIPYGTTLKLTRSYFGTQKVLKSLSEVDDVWANVIYEGDNFIYEVVDGREKLIKHETSFLHRDNPILGAYAIIRKTNGEEVLTVMTKKEIDKSWSKAKTKNVQNDFPQEMSKRTVINRAAKAFINTSDDSDILIDAINRTTSNEFEEDQPLKDVTDTISENANQELLEFPQEKHQMTEAEKEPVVPEQTLVQAIVKKEQTTLLDEPGF